MTEPPPPLTSSRIGQGSGQEPITPDAGGQAPADRGSSATAATPSTEPAAVLADAAENLKEEATSPVVKSATRRIVAGFVAILVCLVVLGILAATIRRQGLDGLDTAATPFLHGYASPGLDAFMNGATFVGSDPVLAVLFVATLLVLIRLGRPWREWLFLAVALGGSVILNGTMKLLFQRPRPTLPYAILLPDYSFPSGHSMNSFVFYLSIALLIWVIAGRRAGFIAGVVALVIATTVGISRVYLGYHYATDVIGGFTAGLLWLLIIAAIFEMGPRVRHRWRPSSSR